MIFPTWSQPTIEHKVSEPKVKPSKNKPKQLQLNFDKDMKVEFSPEIDDAFIKLLNKLSKDFSSKIKVSASDGIDLNQHISTQFEFFKENDSNNNPTSKQLEIEKCCEHYGIDPQNVVAITVEVKPGTFLHRITVEKELF